MPAGQPALDPVAATDVARIPGQSRRRLRPLPARRSSVTAGLASGEKAGLIARRVLRAHRLILASQPPRLNPRGEPREWEMSERRAARLHMTQASSRRGGPARIRPRRRRIACARCCGLAPAPRVAAFNAADGEWLCRIAAPGARRFAARRSSACSGRPKPSRICGCCSRRSSGRASIGWSRRRPSSESRTLLPVLTGRTQIERAQSRPTARARRRRSRAERAAVGARTALPAAARPMPSPHGRPGGGSSSATRPARASRSPTRSDELALRTGGAADRSRGRVHRDGA